MSSPDLIRWSGLAAMLGAALGIILTPPFVVASAFSSPGGAEDLPHWVRWVRVMFPLDFAPAEQVYNTYGRVYFLTMLPELCGLYALRGSRGGRLGVLEKWGFRLSLIGLWVVVAGIFTDYWTHTPPGIMAEVFGSLILQVGFALLGLGFWRSKVLPRWASLPMIVAGPGLVPVMGVLPHAPSGFLLLFHVAWIALGYVLWSGREGMAEQAARVK